MTEMKLHDFMVNVCFYTFWLKGRIVLKPAYA